MEEDMKTGFFFAVALLSFKSHAFCGFYVAKADTSLFNKASQVVIVRDKDRTVISMMNDYEGDLKDFAMVVPVPQILKKEQVNVGDKKLFSRIDSFTAPRLVEYFDSDPCYVDDVHYSMGMAGVQLEKKMRGSGGGEKALGVTVEDQYSIGEYDIVILSAKESKGLETWLRQNNYSIPKGASQALAPYIKQKMNFFVAKVNLKEQEKTSLNYLRPLQFAFESKKFMLPIRLGMLNAKGPQDLFVYVLTKNGRVETTNYPTVRLPSDKNLPVFVKNEFSDFYKDMFSQQVNKEKMKAVFMEYFWDMSWCDPCAADPLTAKELRELGVFWIDENLSGRQMGGFQSAKVIRGSQPVKVTRLHLRYTKKTFPEDLMFQETNDDKNFQARYILNHPWKPTSFKKQDERCERLKKEYFSNLFKRLEKSAQNLASLTGWDINEIRKKMDMDFSGDEEKKKAWWSDLWEKKKEPVAKNADKEKQNWWKRLWSKKSEK